MPTGLVAILVLTAVELETRALARALSLPSLPSLPFPAFGRGTLRIAPVGIGAQLMVKDGLPVINQLIPGTASDLSGMLRPGDRILALATGGLSHKGLFRLV